MNILDKDSMPHAPLGGDVLTALEQALKVSLPSSYRTFLGQYNGGIVKDEIVFKALSGDEGAVKIEGFSGVLLNDAGVADFSAFQVQDAAIDAHFLIIGHDGCGNYLCLRKSGEDAGKIYWLDHDSDETLWQAGDLNRQDCEVAWSSLFLVQNSFEALLEAADEDGGFKAFIDDDEAIAPSPTAPLHAPVKPAVFGASDKKKG